MPDGVISDTSPLQYLHQAGCLDLLRDIYSRVAIPRGVAAELAAGHKLGVSLPETESLDWIETVEAPHLEILPLAVDLGAGEREVLALAVSRPGSLALLDDRLARHFAELLQIRYTGTLGVLLKAREQSLLPRLRPVLDRLETLGFRLDPKTRTAVLDLAGES